MNETTPHDVGMNPRGDDPVSSSPQGAGPDEWDGYGSQLDLLAATLYQARSHSLREMTPERWARIVRMFPSSARITRDDALAMLDA